MTSAIEQSLRLTLVMLGLTLQVRLVHDRRSVRCKLKGGPMGLVRAARDSVAGVAADQWLEFFNCGAIPESLLAVRGSKWVNSRGRTTRGDDNIISNGSRVAVADGQCLIVVHQGRVLDVCAEPGEYIFDHGSEPSVFGGGSIQGNAIGALKNTWERFRFGGRPSKDSRVYFFNTKELIGNKYGTSNPVPFRVVDANVGLDIDIAIRFFGQYSYRISNPILFYKNVAGNFPTTFARQQIDGQLKAELLEALQSAIAKISARGVRYSALPGHTIELVAALNEVLAPRWRNLRGLEIVSFSVASVSASPEDERMIKDLQRAAVLRDPTMASAILAGSHARALEAAAANEAGAAVGFMGLGMAHGATGGLNPAHLYAMGRPGTRQRSSETGHPKPVTAGRGWRCSVCTATNAGKFCAECGSAKPAGEPQYQCDKCGWKPTDPTMPTKFCPECGDPFDDGDLV